MNIKHVYILDCSASMSIDQINEGIIKIGDMIDSRDNGIYSSTAPIFFWCQEDHDDNFLPDIRKMFPEAKLHLVSDGLLLTEDLNSVDTINIVDWKTSNDQISEDHFEG